MAEADPLEQLGAEARELEEDTRGEGAPPGAGAAAGSQAAPEGASPSEGAAGGAPEAEVIQNPAPAIAAVLTTARHFLKMHGESEYAPALAAALDDASISELADALGAVAVKYRLTLPANLDRWREELRVGVALGSIAWRVYQAAHADDGAARAARARDVSPGAPGGYKDPPNPAAGVPPVEPRA